MREKVLPCFLGLALGAATFAAEAFTTGPVPADGVYKFTFGVSETQDGSIPVSADAVCDVNGTYTDTFSYGFLGTTDDSYKNDVPSNLKGVPHAIDGFKVVKGQKIVLHDTNDVNSVSCVCGPAASEYLPAGASSYEGRYPIRFAARMPDRGYYAVTCTVANASSTADADVTLFSERCHTHAQHLTLAPGDTKTFAWSVELAPNFFKTPAKFYYDNAVNVVVVGENAALASLTVVKQPQQTGKVRGSDVADMNVGRTMWLCDDSTGTDQRCDTPYFMLQNYSGVGSGLSRWAPASLSIRNQGEGGLATGANTHRKSCLLKPGDYLYVEYGHNESSTESYTNNLETYLADANEAGANLVVVSPLERHYSWDSANSKWNRSLQGYAEAGEAWVEAKIAAGATNVAFIDLNKPFADWMNAEIVRINAVNPNVSLRNAIDYYFYSAKGGKVDATHPNNAGADWAAYLVWSNAVARVAAGEAEGATDSQKIQAAVLKGITEGVAASVASDVPWSVTEDIINAGGAPNSYWDASVRAGYDYAKNAAVASVDATCTDGVVTLSGVKMRVMNQVNYAKAVIDVVDADGETTRYWSYYNYDASGNNSGEIVIPEAAGFIDADLNKDDPDIASHVSQTLTIPAGAKGYIWFAEASGNTWQVGENGPISAVYPLEAWTDVLVDDDCASTSAWNNFTRAVTTFEVPDGEDYIAFTSTARDSTGYHKAGVFYLTLPEGKEFSDGRVRVSFKALYNGGNLRFVLADSLGNSTNTDDNEKIVPNSLKMLTLNSTKATVFGSSAVEITMSADETPVAQNDINGDSWLDVDMILNLDTRKALASVGGSEYLECTIPDAGTPFKYFGIQPNTYSTHDGAIDDVKIMTLAPSPKHLVEAVPSNDACGHVEINGSEVTSLNAVEGADVVLKAVSADAELYKFVEWQDAEGNTVSTKQTLVIEDVAVDCAYTAVFREYAHDENRITTWDFSDYAVSEIAATGNQTVDCNGMSIFLQNGDTITGDGIRWANAGLKKWDGTVSDSGRHIEWKAPADGDFSLTFQISAVDTGKSVYPYMCVATNEQSMVYSSSAWKSLQAKNIDTDYTISFSATKGTLYKLYAYYQNRDSAVCVSSATFSCTPTYITATAAVNNANYGSATANGAAAAEVFSGREVTFVATPASSAYRFVNWTDGEENIVSTEATFTVPVSADVAYTANFEKAAAGDAVELSYDFAPFASRATSYTEVSTFDYGCFKFQMISGDSAGASGATWYKVAVDDMSTLGTALSETGDHYIKFTAPYDGTVSFKTSVDSLSSKYKAALYIKAAEAASACTNSGDAKVDFTEANKVYTLSLNVTAGTTYYVWAYSWNAGAGGYSPYINISSVTYSHASDPTTLTVANSDSTAGTVTVNGAAVAGTMDVQKGEYVHLVATPSGANVFAGWENGDGEMVSDAADCWLCVEDATSLTATWRSVNTHAFTWNRNVSEGDWNDPANWLYEGVVPATTYPSDAEADYATFDTAATVNLGENVYVKEMWANEDVTFEGGKTISLKMSTGDGKLTLNGVGLSNVSGKSMVVSNDLAIAGTDASWFNALSSTVELRGAISGGAPMNFWLNDNSSSRVRLYGNNNDYTGDAKVTGGLKSNRRSVFCFENEYAAGTNAYWTVEYNAASYNKDEYRMVKGTTRFGGYWGEISDTARGSKIVIGYLNRNSYIFPINPNGPGDNRRFDVEKIGTADLRIARNYVRNLNLKAGSVSFDDQGMDIATLTLAADTKIYLKGDAAWTAGTVTNLFSYTTLAGAGSLVDQVEVTGLAEGLAAEISIDGQIVNAKIIAVPYTDDESAATIAKNQDGSYIVTITAESAVLTVPAGVTVSEVVVSPNTATVTGVPANATLKVAVSWTDAQDVSQSAAYAIVKVDSVTGAVSLDEDAVVTVGEEEIALKPQLSDAGDEVAPLDVGEKVSVGIKSIPGLVYRLARGMTPDGINTVAENAVATETATSSRVSLTDEEPPAGAAFYRVTVDLK